MKIVKNFRGPEFVRLQGDFPIQEPQVHGVESTYTAIDSQTGEPLQFDTFVADGRKNAEDKTMLVFQAWSGYVTRPFEQQRLRMMSEVTQSRIVSIDNLGVGKNTSKIPKHLGRQIAKGDFSEHSKLQWQVAEQILPDSPDHVDLSYYSLGTTMALSMAANAPERRKVDNLLLWDCAAIEPQQFAKFALTYLVDGGKNWTNYLKENPEWVEKPSNPATLAKQLSRQPAGHYLYPRGMARKSAIDDLKLAHEKGTLTKDSVIHVMNNSDSKVSPTALNNKFAAEIAVLPPETPDIKRIIYLNETHAVQDSFPRFAQAIGRAAVV